MISVPQSLAVLSDSALGERIGALIAMIAFGWFGMWKSGRGKYKQNSQSPYSKAMHPTAVSNPPTRMTPTPEAVEKQMSEYLGVQDGLDTSTPANLVNWIVHLSEKMGLLWARIICDQHPISKEIEDRFGVVHVEISIYTRLFLVAVARCKLMGSNVNSPYNQQALTLLNSTLALQQKKGSSD